MEAPEEDGKEERYMGIVRGPDGSGQYPRPAQICMNDLNG